VSQELVVLAELVAVVELAMVAKTLCENYQSQLQP